MLKISYLIAGLAVLQTLHASDIYLTDNQKLPELKMPKNGLPFSLIEGYQNYRIVATHFRTDKNELRYILANPIAYNALRLKTLPLPEGSKVVKIGWSISKMGLFPAALEAGNIERVEYMVKDSSRFNANGDHWGYARFVKKKGRYQSWDKGTQGCIDCHAAAQNSDYLFSRFQKTF